MLWVFAGLIGVVTMAVTSEVNRRVKLGSVSLNFWRTLWATLAFSPALFIYDLPTNSIFYISAILTGLVSAIVIITTFHLSSNYNGRVASLWTSIATFTTFILWFLFDNDYRQEFLSEPLVGSLITVCLIASCVSMWFMRSTNGNGGYIKILLGVALLHTFVTIFAKVAVSTEDIYQQIWIYSFFIMFTQVVFCAFFIMLTGRSFNRSGKILKWSSFLAVFGVIGCVVTWFSLIVAPNPAYAQAILMTTPVFMLAYHKLFKIEDKANPVAGTIMAIAMIGLVLLQA